MTQDDALYMAALLRKQIEAARRVAAEVTSMEDRAVLLVEAESLQQEITALKDYAERLSND